MPTQNTFEDTLQDLIIDICAVMYDRGYRSVPVGAIMRLIGVSEEKAAQHDQEIFQLDDEFSQLIEKKKPKRRGHRVTVPPDVTLH
jgi:hypothetical protein